MNMGVYDSRKYELATRVDKRRRIGVWRRPIDDLGDLFAAHHDRCVAPETGWENDRPARDDKIGS